MFFLGGEDIRKIPWFNWDTIWFNNENKGLGVRRLW